MEKETLDALINATAYHLETGRTYHLYIECPRITKRERRIRSEELTAGKGKKELCCTCRNRLAKMLRDYIRQLSP